MPQRRGFVVLGLRALRPLTAFKMPRTLNVSKICPDDCFLEFQSGGAQVCQKLVEKSEKKKTTLSGQIFKFSTNF